MSTEFSSSKDIGKIHPRKPLVAFLLSVFFNGLGQIYNGQLKKGIVFFVLPYIILVVISSFKLCNSFSGFVIAAVLLSGLKIYTIIDAVSVAKKLKLYVLKKYNTWYFHLFIAFTILFVSLILNIQTILGGQTFILPTTSNYPTTLVGDRVYVNLNAYKESKINYGDMVVFNSPQAEVWTFRVIGIPGDKIETKNRELLINGKKIKVIYEKESIDGNYEVRQLLEELPNGFKHNIYRYKNAMDSSILDIPEIIVPSDSYYLLGDNRDNAYDSRYFGTVKKEDIFAQMMYVFWSSNFDRIGFDFRKSK